MHFSDSLLRVRGIMARVLHAARKEDRSSTLNPLTSNDLQLVDTMMLLLSQPETREMFEKKTPGSKSLPLSSIKE